MLRKKITSGNQITFPEMLEFGKKHQTQNSDFDGGFFLAGDLTLAWTLL